MEYSPATLLKTCTTSARGMMCLCVWYIIHSHVCLLTVELLMAASYGAVSIGLYCNGNTLASYPTLIFHTASDKNLGVGKAGYEASNTKRSELC